MRTPLHASWTLRATGGQVPPELVDREVPATVPGTVHTDLLAAGLVPDPYLDENEAALQWVGRTAWRYTAPLRLDPPRPGERVELVLLGVDTVAEVRLDGHHLGSPRNQHRTHRYDVTPHLGADADHELVVDLAAQLDAAEAMSTSQGPRVHTNAHPFNAVRKMACNFGWDWGPDLVTAGLWRPVLVDRWRTARLGDVRALVTVDGDTGRVELPVDVVRDPAATSPVPLRVTARVHGHGLDVGTTAETTNGHLVVALDVPGVRRWWPRGHGDQPLYDVEVTLSDAATGDVLDTWGRRTGFRSVALDTAPDADGTPFVLSVNDEPVLVRGANWIPDDCFPHRVDRERYARRLADATEAGMNLLRVWGGGLYESDDLYDLCDEQGVLLWQDFLFACAAYAEEPPLSSEVVAEATEAVTRLAPHPSLVVWNGNNENLWGHGDWDWKAELGDLSWGRGYYLDVLPRLLERLDPTRPYSPGSPWSFDETRHPNDPDHGTMHVWDVWNREDYTLYRDYRARFVSEFGYQGPPTWATLTRALHDEPLGPDSPGMRAHQKAEDGDLKLSRGIAPHLPVPADPVTDLEDWHWAMQLQQAHAVAFGIEHFRSWHPRNAGTIVWQLNDCWPVTSWAAVDGDGRRKPLWFALRHAYADRVLTVQPRDGGLALVAGNDTGEPWRGSVDVRRLRLDGTQRAMTTVALDVPARGTHTVTLPRAVVTDVSPYDELLVATAPGARTVHWFAEPKDLALVDGWAEAVAEPEAGGCSVRVTAASVQRDVCLLVDKVDPDATVDDGMVTVLPGETHVFHVRGAVGADPTELTSARVLRSANQLLRHRGGDPADGGRTDPTTRPLTTSGASA
ncbi:glycoside hydrolase family 2 protein [Lapillicoccus jejuensis]|uniref:beta-mannosidase n=1 Tax=Lapillicoccus jejuensis TaxID=402171 RepID=A0A542DYI8_9MICO|nr:glycoside hydrolase family 2 protein [Lapillicoccus jejuensis]TQJ08163.1 beta-mannosidase [Lapillicoccus jejuensis]